MFGIRIVTKKRLQEIEQAVADRAMAQLVELLRHKDRIYLEPVTLVGHSQIVQDCAFLGIEGTALTIKPSKVALAEATLNEQQ